ncbi:MAG: hypothetical protein ACOYNL_05570 [Rickettsiales bacterium]
MTNETQMLMDSANTFWLAHSPKTTFELLQLQEHSNAMYYRIKDVEPGSELEEQLKEYRKTVFAKCPESLVNSLYAVFWRIYDHKDVLSGESTIKPPRDSQEVINDYNFGSLMTESALLGAALGSIFYPVMDGKNAGKLSRVLLDFFIKESEAAASHKNRALSRDESLEAMNDAFLQVVDKLKPKLPKSFIDGIFKVQLELQADGSNPLVAELNAAKLMGRIAKKPDERDRGSNV